MASPLKILFVEDEVLIALDTCATLEALGHEDIMVCYDFESAVVEAATGSYDLALLDLDLRGQSSLPIARTLVKTGTAVIFITAQSDERALAEFGSPVIGKPYRPEDLDEEIRRFSRAV